MAVGIHVSLKVYICDKPSMAEMVAATLSLTPLHKKNGYYQKNELVITWVTGQVVTLAGQEFYGQGESNSDKVTLPLVPDVLQYVVSDKYRRQFSTLRKLISKAVEVTIVGEKDGVGLRSIYSLLFHCRYKKALFKCSTVSLRADLLQAALTSPVPDSSLMIPLARQEVDWLYRVNFGMLLRERVYQNSTRFGKTFRTDRLALAAVALVTQRERKLLEISDRSNREIIVNLKSRTGEVFDVIVNVPKTLLVDGVITDAAAERVKAYISDLTIAKVTTVNEQTIELPPPEPYNFNALQSELYAENIPPNDVADLAKSLYLHPLACISWPFSSGTTFPSEHYENALLILGGLLKLPRFKHVSNLIVPQKPGCFEDIAGDDWGIMLLNSNVDLKRLSRLQIKLFEILAVRFVMQFLPAEQRFTKSINFSLGNLSGFYEVCNTTRHGWSLLGSKTWSTASLVNHPVEGEILTVLGCKVVTRENTECRRFNQADLVSHLSDVSRIVSTAPSGLGFGVASERPALIKEFLQRGVFKEVSGELIPSRTLVNLASELPPVVLDIKNAIVWEQAYSAIEAGTLDVEEFMKLQSKFIKNAAASGKKLGGSQ